MMLTTELHHLPPVITCLPDCVNTVLNVAALWITLALKS